MEQVPLLKGLRVGAMFFGAMAKKTDKQTDRTGCQWGKSPFSAKAEQADRHTGLVMPLALL